MFKAINRNIRSRFEKWLQSRLVLRKSITLDQKKIFIIPSRYGLLFVLLITALFIGGINYENNLMLGLSFLLASVFIVSILHTFNNLSGLTVSAGKAHSAYVNEDANFEVHFSCKETREHENVTVYWEGATPQSLSLLENKKQLSKLMLPATKRGLFKPGRLRVQTRYPVGLFHAWSIINLDMESLVYPAPVKSDEIPVASSEGDGDEAKQGRGTDEFDSLRKYQDGDNLSHIDWKVLAKKQGLYTKTFLDHSDGELWLDWNALDGITAELRLSILCYWILRLEAEHKPYGLMLVNKVYPVGAGEQHKVNLLTALALF